MEPTSLEWRSVADASGAILEELIAEDPSGDVWQVFPPADASREWELRLLAADGSTWLTLGRHERARAFDLAETNAGRTRLLWDAEGAQRAAHEELARAAEAQGLAMFAPTASAYIGETVLAEHAPTGSSLGFVRVRLHCLELDVAPGHWVCFAGLRWRWRRGSMRMAPRGGGQLPGAYVVALIEWEVDHGAA